MRFSSCGKYALGFTWYSLVAVTVLTSVLLRLPLLSPRTLAASAGEGMVVVLDAGHGGEDSGTVGVNGVYEKDLNLAVARMIASNLTEAGVRVILTRNDDRMLYTPEDAAAGRKKAGDLRGRLAAVPAGAIFVSIHMNSFPVEKYDGLQIWYAATEGSDRLAEAIRKNVVSRVQPNNRRHSNRTSGTIYLLDHATVPSVLVECGFLSNRAECEKLSTEDYQRELSFAIFCGMMEYIQGS